MLHGDFKHEGILLPNAIHHRGYFSIWLMCLGHTHRILVSKNNLLLDISSKTFSALSCLFWFSPFKFHSLPSLCCLFSPCPQLFPMSFSHPGRGKQHHNAIHRHCFLTQCTPWVFGVTINCDSIDSINSVKRFITGYHWWVSMSLRVKTQDAAGMEQK